MLPKEDQPLYPYQKQIFDKLKDKYKTSGLKWPARYMALQAMSKTPVYARLAGQIPISFDEGIGLMHQEGIRLNDCLQTPDVISDMDEFLMQDLCHFNALEQKQVVQVIQDLPLIYLKMNRLLGGFKLYCYARLWTSPTTPALEPFSREWMIEKRVAEKLDAQKKMLQYLLQMPRTDIWTESMFDSTAKVINYIDQVGGFAHRSIKEDIISSLFSLIGDLKKIALNQSMNITIYENTLFSIGNQFFFQAADYSVLYFWSDTNLKIRITDLSVIQDHQILIKNMLSRAVRIDPESEVQFIQFFSRLENRIKTILK